MSFDKPTRNKLASVVGECRRLLTDDIRHQLQAVYGLQPDGYALPVASLGHLDELGREVAQEIRDWQGHLASTEIGPEGQRKKNAFDRVARETGFTVLNRLAALRMCEERGHAIECVRRGMESDGFVLYERLSGGVFGTRGETYHVFLGHMFDELAVDLGVLFDCRVPQSLVFPRERCLEEVLSLLNSRELTHLWKEDETIGWIYQYFNSREEREAMRAASAAPRNSRELAARNQFFTPRFVVEFLMDNTLGRIWYEMRKGDTALMDACRYLVRRPIELLLKQGEEAPALSNAEEYLSQEEILKRPVYIPHRPKKDPRDLRILDPAVGSGHFLLYAFDLLETIYEEAWADEQVVRSEITGKTLRQEYPDLDSLKRDLPELVLRHNLHGIDIDLRACQIAALALWLRAQKTYQRLGLKPADRPNITRSNIVCAEPMPGERQLLDQFVADLQPKVLGQLVQDVFEKMEVAGEAGLLLKIEEEISGAVADAKKKWLAGPKPEQQVLFDGLRMQPAESNLDFSGITDAAFWEKAEERIYSELQNYAKRAENGHGYRRRLFAEDTARGFAFIDECRNRFNVIISNPPFGDPARSCRKYLEDNYTHLSNDISVAFVQRAKELLLNKDEFFGFVFPRNPFFLQSFADFRTQYLLGTTPVDVAADLGFGVLDDAMIEITAFTATNCTAEPSENRSIWVCRLLRTAAKQTTLESAIGGQQNDVYVVDVNRLRAIPGVPFAYWPTPRILELLASGTYLNGITDTKWGLFTADDPRFLRLWWEINDPEWKPYYKGGAFARYVYDSETVVDFRMGGRAIKENRDERGRSRARLPNQEFYFRRGLTFPNVTFKGLALRALPEGAIFSLKGPGVFPTDDSLLWPLLAFLNTRVAEVFVAAQSPTRRWDLAQISRIPIPPLDRESTVQLTKFARLAAQEELARWSILETSHYFVSPALGLAGYFSTLSEFVDSCRFAEKERLQTLESLQATCEDIVQHLYQFGDADKDCVAEFTGNIQELEDVGETYQEVNGDIDETSSSANSVVVSNASEWVSYFVGVIFGRWDIRYATGQRTATRPCDPFALLPVCPAGMLQNDEGLPLTQVGVVRLQAAGQCHYPIEIPWDGILVDDLDHPNDIVRRVREVLTLIWKDRAEAIEHEAGEILDVKDLGEYFRKPSLFFADHLKRYSKSRRQAPIYWPLSTTTGSYTLWIYYHRLNDDLLYTALNRYVKPKIDATEKSLHQIETDLPTATGLRASKLRFSFEEQKLLLDELHEFRDELARVAALPYKPNLNDGVLISASPLWKLFRLPKWRKDLKECWERLEGGKHEWAHLAYSIWPNRVREACKRDRSIAIAHCLEELCDVADTPAKKKRAKKVAVEEIIPGDEE